MIKMIGSIFTICSSIAIGTYFSQSLTWRIEALKEIKYCILLLKGDIRYACTPLPEAFASIGGRKQNAFGNFFLKLSQQLNRLDGTTFVELWKAAVETELSETALKKSDKESLEKLGESLGYLDKEMQLNQIDFYLTQLEEEMKQLEGEKKDKKKLYQTLGIMGGIFLTILLL